ncbi:MAG: DUF1850 domain-containing protein [Synergistaceae bacterium]|jgi:hypothetical protein|nr:DUF1850 domain-containing protein [Synergistaceae bacterium]
MFSGCSEKNLILVARGALALLCLFFLVPEMPVNYLSISGPDGVLFAAPVPHGGAFFTTYIHSVQKTPVVDEYRIADGKIWGWEELVHSHGAGLPFSAPEHGRFVVAPPGMIVQGGRRAEERIVYRVGNETLGRNLWRLPPFEEVWAYERFPGARVFIESSIRKFKDAPVIGWQGGEYSRRR